MRSKSDREETFEEPAPAPKATPQEWAKRKGMLDRFGASSGTFAMANPLYQDFAQARAFKAWADDTQVTEDEFDAAVLAAKTTDFR